MCIFSQICTPIHNRVLWEPSDLWTNLASIIEGECGSYGIKIERIGFFRFKRGCYKASMSTLVGAFIDVEDNNMFIQFGPYDM